MGGPVMCVYGGDCQSWTLNCDLQQLIAEIVYQCSELCPLFADPSKSDGVVFERGDVLGPYRAITLSTKNFL